MNLTRRNLLILALAAMPFTPSVFAQKISPAGTAEVTLGDSKITIAYSRPYVKGRKIMGGLASVWSSLANRGRRRNGVNHRNQFRNWGRQGPGRQLHFVHAAFGRHLETDY